MIGAVNGPDRPFPSCTDAAAQVEAEIDAGERTAPVRPLKSRQTNRGSLVKHLERVEVVVEPERSCACGAERHVIGEAVSERLDVIPAQFRVIDTHRPRYARRFCEGGITERHKNATGPICEIDKNPQNFF